MSRNIADNPRSAGQSPTFTYARVSARERDTGGMSLDAQNASVQNYIFTRNLPLRFSFNDDGVSGAKPLAERPEGRRLCLAIAEGPCRVIVAKFDRAFRSVLDFARTVAEWQEIGVEFVSVADGFDMSTIFGRFQANLLAAFAELERGQIGERTRAVIDLKKKKGERWAHEPLYGKRHVDSGRTNAHGDPIFLVEDDPKEQDWIGMMKRWRRDKCSFRKIAARLDGLGCKPRRGGQWTEGSVFQILKRETRARRSPEKDDE